MDKDKVREKRGHCFARYAGDCNIYVRSQKAGERVMVDTTKGLSIRTVANKYSVSPSFVSKITCRWKQEGSVSPRRMGTTGVMRWKPVLLKSGAGFWRTREYTCAAVRLD